MRNKSGHILVPTDIPNPLDGGWLCVWLDRPSLLRDLWGCCGLFWFLASQSARDSYRIDAWTALRVAVGLHLAGSCGWWGQRQLWRHYTRSER